MNPSLTCRIITEELNTTVRNMLQGANYSDIFGNVDEQFRNTKIFQNLLTTREHILASRHHQGLPRLHNSGPDLLLNYLFMEMNMYIFNLVT